jgi:hypothetical protein
MKKKKKNQPKKRDGNILKAIRGEISLRERIIVRRKYSRKKKHKARDD